jgi:hypothetical protein
MAEQPLLLELRQAIAGRNLVFLVSPGIGRGR